MEKTIRVTVHGRTYPLRVAASDEAFTRRVADMVDARMKSMGQQVPGQPDLTHAVLAALSIGEELVAAQQQLENLQHLADDADALAERLEAALDAPAGDGAARPAAAPGRPAKKQPTTGATRAEERTPELPLETSGAAGRGKKA
jgi:cell division protein ZapA (FtsZ GTPase activity inhibitor)